MAPHVGEVTLVVSCCMQIVSLVISTWSI